MEQLLIIVTVWGTLTAFGLWLFAIAKQKVPITVDEATVLWKIHKQNVHCSQRKWHPLTERSGKVTGFKCECGYKYSQRRHFVISNPKSIETTAKMRSAAAPAIANFYASNNQQSAPKPVARDNRARANRKSLLK